MHVFSWPMTYQCCKKLRFNGHKTQQLNPRKLVLNKHWWIDKWTLNIIIRSSNKINRVSRLIEDKNLRTNFPVNFSIKLHFRLYDLCPWIESFIFILKFRSFHKCIYVNHYANNIRKVLKTNILNNGTVIICSK